MALASRVLLWPLHGGPRHCSPGTPRSVPLRPHQAGLRTGCRPAAVPGGGQLFSGGSSESSLCVYLCSSEHVTYKILFHAFSRLTLEH